MEINYQILQTSLLKLIFFQDVSLQKQIEKSFLKEISLSENITYRELVENLCSIANDLKQPYEKEKNNLLNENIKLKENIEALKTENLKLETELMGVEKYLKEFYEKDLQNNQEKVEINFFKFYNKFINIIYYKKLIKNKFCLAKNFKRKQPTQGHIEKRK